MPTAPQTPLVIVLMGVSGSGKSTTGAALSRKLGWPFRDADSFHPPANVAKMSRGTPLTDEDRGPWLDAIAQWIDERCEAGDHGIVSCSALKRAYRDRIVGARSGVRLVYLEGDRQLIAQRLRGRKDHFMPASLLESQFAALEEPGPDERPLIVSIALSPRRVVDAIVERLGLEARTDGA
jgi:carbohydrate kinase (thermoresistant glucokinase family)